MTTPNNTGAETALRALVPALQSMRDRMMAALPSKFGEGFDGDMDTLLEVINAIKRVRPPEDAHAVDGGDAEPLAWLVMYGDRVVGWTDRDNKDHVRIAKSERLVPVGPLAAAINPPAVEREAVETQAEQSDRRAFPMGYDSHLHGLVTDNVASALLCCGIDYLPAGVLDTIASEIVRSYYAAPPEPEWAGDLILAHKTALEASKSENPPKTLFAGIEQDLRRVMIALWGTK